MADRVGQQLGNYRLTRLLGRGGFAEVYLGEHRRLKTQAAIKVLHTQLAETDVEGFLIEAQFIARLEHPHIVRILDFDVEESTPFLVMSYAPNGTLRQLHPKDMILPLSTVVNYIKQIADALQYAHDEKLIHRDIKPENMLLGRRNEVLLSDFGIAIVAQSSRYQGTQDMAGTIAYMAPEQIQAHPRPASDQYSLAIVAYEWLTGVRPFHGSFTEIAIKHSVVPPPPLREKLSTISLTIQEVVLTALAKDPKERFGSVQAFANALEQASQTDAPTFIKPIVPLVQNTRDTLEEKPSTPVENSIVTPSLPPTELAEAVIKTTLAPFLLPTELALPLHPEETVLYTYRGHSARVNAVAWSHDGKRVVSGSEDKMVHVWDANTGHNVFIYKGHSDSVNTVAWSPSGGRIASGSNDKTVHVWDAVTGKRFITYYDHFDIVKSVAWSPSSTSIVSGSYSGAVHLWDSDKGKYIVIYRGHSYPINAVAWSSDEEYIASGGNSNEVHVWKATAGRKIFSYQNQSNWIKAISWSPDGTCIASTGDDKAVQVWNAVTGATIYIYRGHSGGVNAIAWSSDGKYIASGDEHGMVQVWNAANGEHVYTYRDHSGSVLAVAWSPDGKLIASSSSDGTVHVWLAR